MQKLAIAALFVLISIGLVGCAPDLTCNVIHEPKGGCPAGYEREATPRFTEKDGSKEYACVARVAGKEQCTDVLKPGETETFEIEVRP